MRPDASRRLAAAAPKKGPNPVVIGAVVAAVVIVGVVVAILIGRPDSGSGATPAGVTGGKGGGILVGGATAKSNAPTLDVYEDFQCPGCAQLENAIGPTLASMTKAGEIKLVVHMMSFLDDKLPRSNKSSTRAANATACAVAPGKFLEYHAAVFAAQPKDEGVGYTDAQLTEFAKASGITGAALTTWQTCTSSGQHDQYVTDVQEATGRAGINNTPTVKLNGQDISPNETRTLTPEQLVALVKAATK